MMRSVALICLLAAPALAQEMPGDAEAGGELFARACATCHGADAKGMGPMAAALLVQPTDLTTLMERHDGVFPITRIVMRIDGRDPLVSHGSLMPIWGDYFESDEGVAIKAETGQPIMTSQPIVDLVAYLATLQE